MKFCQQPGKKKLNSKKITCMQIASCFNIPIFQTMFVAWKERPTQGNATSDEDSCWSCHFVNLLKDAFCPGMTICTNHAMNPHIPIQGAPEIPFCIQAISESTDNLCSFCSSYWKIHYYHKTSALCPHTYVHLVNLDVQKGFGLAKCTSLFNKTIFEEHTEDLETWRTASCSARTRNDENKQNASPYIKFGSPSFSF